eukprot:TRINITY_DN5226_c0_g1_i1.p1 TRINITY_DN5226_c0_g1~~TRINITY_DN5226_c0_g1_i1.p1  ORF type:complete len:771 (-),score=153.12 TRINITY_DN5226_c0_g1_i1:7-2319(-)
MFAPNRRRANLVSITPRKKSDKSNESTKQNIDKSGGIKRKRSDSGKDRTTKKMKLDHTQEASEGDTVTWSVQYEKKAKKQKKWVDGYVTVDGTQVCLLDAKKKRIVKIFSNESFIESIQPDETLVIGMYEVLFEEIESDDNSNEFKVIKKEKEDVVLNEDKIIRIERVSKKSYKAKYNITDPDAVILYEPEEEEGKLHVLVDPGLSRYFRPHQIEGVKFMYNCVMGFTTPNQYGCILADDMGLGKTLQSIAVMWTLLKQSPNAGKITTKNILVVCPTTLVKNWGKEISKWLKLKAECVMISDQSKSNTIKILDHFQSIYKPILIMSYEQCRIHIERLKKINFGLMICDEGHRLRNPSSKTTAAINSLPCRRRILLSGTPYQNNLEEFYALVDFVNPGVLGDPSDFKRKFTSPILLANNPKSDEDTIKKGVKRANKLYSITSQFLLRRNSTVLEDYLPPKNSFVLFCRPSDVQTNLYKSFLTEIDTGGTTALGSIAILTQLCSHPSIIYPKYIESNRKHKKILPPDFDHTQYRYEYSGKMDTVHHLLLKVRQENPSDKVVLVSFSKKMLNYFELMCKSLDHQFSRIDGSTNPKERMDIVDEFNDPRSSTFIILLSAKAAGEGLNLIGANRLILYDCDWNPAYENQAMARIWRDGQKKEVFIYRLLSTGTIEEKIFQRQMEKQSMSSKVVGADFVSQRFTPEDLKRIFTLTENTDCETLLIANEGNESSADELAKWEHYEPSECGESSIELCDSVSYIFFNSTKPKHFSPDE